MEAFDNIDLVIELKAKDFKVKLRVKVDEFASEIMPKFQIKNITMSGDIYICFLKLLLVDLSKREISFEI